MVSSNKNERICKSASKYYAFCTSIRRAGKWVRSRRKFPRFDNFPSISTQFVYRKMMHARLRFFWRRNTKHTSKQPQKEWWRATQQNPRIFRSLGMQVLFNFRDLRCRTQQHHHKTICKTAICQTAPAQQKIVLPPQTNQAKKQGRATYEHCNIT